MRDITKVFQGLCLGHKSVITSQRHLITLLNHEMNRAFKDRLTDPQDVVYYSKVATTQILEKFNRLEQEESV